MTKHTPTMKPVKTFSAFIVALLLTVGGGREGFARITEPDVVYFGAVTGGTAGSLLTLKLDADGTILKTTTLDGTSNYLLRLPMDSVEPRVPGTARSGEKATFYLGTKVIQSVVIPEQGTIVTLALSVVAPSLAEWQKLHPGDDGSGDSNRNGVSDLQDYLNGNDPYHLWNLLTLSTLADNSIVNNATLNVAGTVSDNGSGLGVKEVSVNGQTALLTNGSFSIGIPLLDGANSITVVAVDTADHKTMVTRNITLDRSAPLLIINQPSDNGVTGNSYIAVSGSVDQPTTVVSAKVNNGAATGAAMNGGNFTVTLGLVPGLNTIDVTAQDQAGNISNAKRSLLSDTVAPTLAVTSPPQDVSTTEGSILISGSALDTVTGVTVVIAVDARSYTPVVAQDGSFSQLLPLATDKSYGVIVTATDQAGNRAVAQRTIIKTTAAIVTESASSMLADAVKACQHVYGQTLITESEKLRIDCAPLGADGKPSPNGVVDLGDVILLLRRSIGLVNW